MRQNVVTLLLGLLLSSSSVFAQSDETGGEEMVVLSPFVVSGESDSGYSAMSSLAGSRTSTPVLDPRSADYTATVPVTIVKRADAVAIQFLLSDAADKQEVRNQELYATVQVIQKNIAKTPGLRLEQREVRFAGGNRKLLSFGKDGAQRSYVSLVVFAELSPEIRIVERVKQVRDLLSGTKLPGEVKLLDGNVGLYLKQTPGYRREILQKIFEDLEFVKKGLGAEFEVRPSGLNQQVRSRVCSESEIELWIDYSFVIGSVRELTNPKK